MEYNTLTINGITKICDDNIYMYTKEVINYQWHHHQLKYILNILSASTIDPITKLELSKSAMCRKIKDLIKSLDNTTIKVTSNNPAIDAEMGIIPLKKTDTVSIDNMGGISLKKFVLNEYETGIANTTNPYIYNSDIKTPSLPPITTQITSIRQDMIKIGWIRQITPRIREHVPQTDLSELMQKFGAFDWYKNSCYCDTILLMLLLPIFEGYTLSTFVSDNFIDKTVMKKVEYTDDEGRGLNCKKEYSTDQSIDIINNIYKLFNDMVEILNKGNIVHSYKFVASLDECPIKRGIEIYSDGQTHETFEFLTTLLNIFQIQYEQSTKINTYFFKTSTKTYSESLDAIFGYKVEKILYGVNNYVDLDQKTYDSNVIFHTIDFTILHKILKTGLKGALYNTLKDVLQAGYDASGAHYDENLDKWYPTSILSLQNIGINEQKTIYISDFMRYKEEEYPEEYFLEKHGYSKKTIDGKIHVIFPDGSKVPFDEIQNEEIIRIPRVVNEYIIDKGDSVFIAINRLFINSKQKEHFINMKIIPNSDLQLEQNSSLIYLKAIVVWYRSHYILFFSENDIWYLYNDLYNIGTEPGYYQKVGTYDDLLEYSYNGIHYIIKKNSIFYWYNKK